MNLEAVIRAMPADLEIVIIGGVAAQQYVPTYVTNDFDVCFHESPTNWQRVITWLTLFTPTLWVAQQRRPLTWGAATPMQDYTLMTHEGEIDLLHEVDGIGKYPQVKAVSVAATIFGKTLLFLNLQGLIMSKRTTNRPKDQLLLQRLEEVQRQNP